MFDWFDDIDWGGLAGGAWDWVSGGWGDDGGSGAGSLPWEQILGGAIGGWDAARGTPETPRSYLPGQEQAYGTAFGALTDMWNQGPAEYYPGATVAPRNELLTRGENMQLQNMGTLQGLADGSYNAANFLQQGGAGRIGDIAMPDQIGFGLPEEYASAIMNPVMNALNEEMLPGLHTAAQSQGAFGGSRATQQRSDAINRATGTATDALIRGNLQARQQSIGQRAGDISAMLSQRGQNINQNQIANAAALNGVNAATIAQNQQLIPGQVMAGIGADRSAYDQALLNADVDRWNYDQNADQQMLNSMFGWLSGTPSPSGGAPGTPGGDWLDILQGVIQGGNMGGGFAGAGTAPTTVSTQPLPPGPTH